MDFVKAACGHGGLIIDSAVVNTGNIWANGGNVTIHGDVTGSGNATISGTAALELDGDSSINVAFADSNAQTLQFDGFDQFAGAVSGFGFGDTMDFAAFDSAATVSYAADADAMGSILTISEGADTIQIKFTGQYSADGFVGVYQQDHGFVINYDETLLI